MKQHRGKSGNSGSDSSSPASKAGKQIPQPSSDPQLRRIHEGAESPDEAGRGSETSIQDGGARHRNQ
jgi:hypothetical protein